MSAHFYLGEKFENIIIELQKKAIELCLGDVGFDLYMKEYGDVAIKLSQYRHNWEVTVVNECNCGGINYRFLDMYKLSNEGLLKYDHTEKDKL